jgi:ABC transporter, ATP-binding protein
MILRSFPNIMQFGTSDCGVACLSMRCKYYGKHVSLNQIKTISGESKEGLSFQDLELTAEALGFSATASQVSLDVINLDYALPCILT